jgi:predicted RecA/RadA family phage recombinase
MAETLRSDGKAVDVTLLSTVEKGSVVYLEGFFGITMASGSSGDTVAIEVAQREHEIAVPEGVTAAKGDVLYITNAGVITNTSAGNKAFLKVTQAKDSNNYVWGILLPQA